MTHPLVNVSRILKDHDIRSDDANLLRASKIHETKRQRNTVFIFSNFNLRSFNFTKISELIYSLRNLRLIFKILFFVVS